MIEELKPYPAYKDSGVPWLGKVPEHWEVRRLKTAVDHVNQQTTTKTDEDLYIALEHVESWTGRLLPPSGEAHFDGQVKRFQAGDVLFGKLRPYLAKVVRPKQSGVCVGEFLVLRARPVVATHYLEVALRSAPAIDFVNSSTYGAKMPRAEWTFVGAMLFPLPPLPEQTAIVRFLDYMDRRIRRFIRAKQKLIKLLEEYRQALIHHAVTGKIDVRTGKPYPAYKDSGVPWLGEVPEHWEVRRIKTLFRETDERNGDGSGPLLSLTRARGIVPQAEASNRIASVEDLSNYKVCKSGDLIMNRMQAWSGMFAVSGIDGVISPDYSVFKPKAPIDVHYFEALFKTPLLVEEFAKRSKGIGSGFNRLYTPDFGAVPIASPPLSEQTAIVEHLDAQTSKLDTAIAAARREIELLREYRERLIADMVTGKVDVREVAAQLPEELPEEEAELMDMDEIAEGDATDDDAAAEALPEEGVEA